MSNSRILVYKTEMRAISATVGWLDWPARTWRYIALNNNWERGSTQLHNTQSIS